ncbi:L-type lectin-domain containing receptor kinase IX.1-like [Chenopodium quinoa]|uniref:L-type lectin-domain containing receptor kinase IX.1-like n=1 Tax=Chenopodium quinoa TaxID=63459 RepID=UPI000B787F16|nr:L-type lectin-domain containing receptor kinase IX.1-like [Chenopodium quinoa]
MPTSTKTLQYSYYFLLFSTTIFLLQHLVTPSTLTCDHQDNVIFSFPTFNTSNCKTGGNLKCMGAVNLGEGYLNLTTVSTNSSSTSDFNSIGRVLYKAPVLVWPASFCTSFSFKIFSRFDQLFSGDGMTFVMAQDNQPSPIQSFGSYLGLQDSLLSGHSKFQQLAIEFDTFKNEWDPDGNHIGINTISVMDSLVAKSLNSSKIYLKSGKQIRVKIEYDGWKKMLQIFVGYEGSPLKSFINYKIKVSKKIPSQVYLGFTASTGTLTETHQIHDWIFTSTKLPYYTVKDNKKKAIVLASVIPVVGALFIFALIAIPVFRRRMIKKRERLRRMEELERQSAAAAPRKFTYKQLAKATKNFSKDNLLGTGGFGSVYKGQILDPPQTIAVKKISSTSQQGEREYIAEICTIGRLRHRNILQLQGWSHENDSLLLVYDYMANKSLNEYLSGRKFLDWKTRHKVITGLASALLYLHEECGDPVVHRDVKPSNVMLDAEFNPRLGDFGLARLLKNTAGVTTMVAGTLGYMAPEVSYTGKATTESDVYSFGVVALEMVCGKRFSNLLGESCLVDQAWDMHAKGELVECVDPKLNKEFNKDEAVRVLSVALACLHLESNLRPKMRKVVMVLLNSDEPLIELPSTRPKGVYVSLYGFSNPPTMTSSSPSTPLFTWPDYPSSSANNLPDESLAR